MSQCPRQSWMLVLSWDTGVVPGRGCGGEVVAPSPVPTRSRDSVATSPAHLSAAHSVWRHKSSSVNGPLYFPGRTASGGLPPSCLLTSSFELGAVREVRMRDGDFPERARPHAGAAHPALIPQLLFGSRPQSCQSLPGFGASVRVCHGALMAVSPCEAFRHPPSFHQPWETCQALTGSPKQTPV